MSQCASPVREMHTVKSEFKKWYQLCRNMQGLLTLLVGKLLAIFCFVYYLVPGFFGGVFWRK